MYVHDKRELHADHQIPKFFSDIFLKKSNVRKIVIFLLFFSYIFSSFSFFYNIMI